MFICAKILLPLDIWRHRQWLVEILLPYQPIRVLNPFSLEINNHQHSFAIITMSVRYV